jgi:hypothetical protein
MEHNKTKSANEHPAATALRQRVIDAVGQALAEGLHPMEVTPALLRCLVYSMYCVSTRCTGALPVFLEYLDEHTRILWAQVDEAAQRNRPVGDN